MMMKGLGKGSGKGSRCRSAVSPEALVRRRRERPAPELPGRAPPRDRGGRRLVVPAGGMGASSGSSPDGGGVEGRRRRRAGGGRLAGERTKPRAIGWLFVRNLPGNVKEDALEYVFANYGKVVKICIMNGRSPDFKACAFIKYLFSCEAALAIEMLHGKYEMDPGQGPIAVKADVPGVFVDNLPVDTKEELLEFVFSFYGRVQTVHIAARRSAGGRACGFVEFSSTEEAKLAIAALRECGSEAQEHCTGRGRGRPNGPTSLSTALDGLLRSPTTPPTTSDHPLAVDTKGSSALPYAGGGDLCVVCLSSTKTHAFLPCGHRCVCAECGSAVADQASAACPICRILVDHVLQIFC